MKKLLMILTIFTLLNAVEAGSKLTKADAGKGLD